MTSLVNKNVFTESFILQLQNKSPAIALRNQHFRSDHETRLQVKNNLFQFAVFALFLFFDFALFYYALWHFNAYLMFIRWTHGQGMISAIFYYNDLIYSICHMPFVLLTYRFPLNECLLCDVGSTLNSLMHITHHDDRYFSSWFSQALLGSLGLSHPTLLFFCCLVQMPLLLSLLLML